MSTEENKALARRFREAADKNKGAGMEEFIDRFEGGKIVEAWSHLDTMGLMQQLGVIAGPGQGKA
jgi:hypothetical protein